MQVNIRNSPAFGVARVSLLSGETIEVAAAATMACSFGVTETPSSRGGLRDKAKAAPSTFTAPAHGGWLDLVPTTGCGDVYCLEFDGGSGWFVAKNAVIARPFAVRIEHSYAGLWSLFGNDSGFLQHCSGTGPLVLQSTSPVDVLRLQPDEVITVRPEFVLAYPDSMLCRLQAVDPAAPQSTSTGMGLVMQMAGPGMVLLQTRQHR